MKSLIVTSLLIFTIIFVSHAQVVLQIQPKTTLPVEGNTYAIGEAKLFNKSNKDVRVEVVSKETGEFVRGFGLAPKGRVKVIVEQENELQLTNRSMKTLEVQVKFGKMKMKESPAERVVISFTLANNSLRSIPLIIPGVMNPNLSPRSKSGVDLAVGQEIFFKTKGKRQILLIVDENIEEGAIVDVGKLLKERKKELGL